MRPRRLLVVLASSLLVASCTSAAGDDAPPAASPSPTDAHVQAAASPDPSPSPTPTSTPEVVFGTGTVTVDGVAIPVSGDCDVSRQFGEQPVNGLGDDEVDVLLAVDNITGDGDHDGPFAIEVRLLGTGAVEGRTITSQGAAADDGTTVGVTYEGTVDRARLRDRRALEFVDVAILHLEATQQRSGDAAGPRDRDLVVDVVCPISRPG